MGRRGRSSEAAAASSIVRGRRSSISIGRRCRSKEETRRTTVPASNLPSRRRDMHCIEGIGTATGPLQRARLRESSAQSRSVDKNFQCERLRKKSVVKTHLTVFEHGFPYQAIQDEPGQENAVRTSGDSYHETERSEEPLPPCTIEHSCQITTPNKVVRINCNGGSRDIENVVISASSRNPKRYDYTDIEGKCKAPILSLFID